MCNMRRRFSRGNLKFATDALNAAVPPDAKRFPWIARDLQIKSGAGARDGIMKWGYVPAV
jgi:hypothetical protein